MAYLVLARKYRPLKFDDVIGQDHISKTIKNAISEERIAHAYLFSGPRGSGKTTMARIFAKALNCQNPKDSEPCGVCENCKEIGLGISMDVIELDAASNRGIEDIEALRENVRLAAAKSKYKIYIIDEAHQITKDAFNALLKTLEEPPSHVVFIMATTEQHKFPVTILSRCQRYRFKLLSAKEIAGLIKSIGGQENFEIDEEALSIIINASGGSMRDALSLLDQAVSSGTQKITGDYIRGLLGLLPIELISLVCENIAKGDMKKLLEITASIAQDGHDILQFAKDLRDYLRQLMIYAVSPDILDLPPEEKKLFEKQKDLFATARHIRMNNLISRAIEEMRWNDQPRILLEIYLLKMAESYFDINVLLKKIADLENRIKDGGGDFHKESAPEKNEEAQTDGYVEREVEEDAPRIKKAGLMGIWDEITAEISKKNMTADALKKLSVQEISENEVCLFGKDEYDLKWADDFMPTILSLFKQKACRDIAVNTKIKEERDIKDMSDIVEAQNHDDNPPDYDDSNESQLQPPQAKAVDKAMNKQDEIRKRWGAKAKKIDKK
jgi:DNA polymerase-3 subunit gamma/tau